MLMRLWVVGNVTFNNVQMTGGDGLKYMQMKLTFIVRAKNYTTNSFDGCFIVHYVF